MGSEGSLFDRAVAIWKRFEYLHGGKSPEVLGQFEYSDGLVVKAAGFKVVRDHARALRQEDKESIRGAIAPLVSPIASSSPAVEALAADEVVSVVAVDAVVPAEASVDSEAIPVAMSSRLSNDKEGRKRKKRSEGK
jgi:hypothetical protein